MPKRGNRGGAGFPPSFQARPVHRIRVRYVYTGAATPAAPVTIARRDLLDTLVAVATETTSDIGTRVFGGVRLLKVELWSAAATGQMVRLQTRWQGATHGRDEDYVAYGNEFKPAHIVMMPDKHSLQGFWADTTGSSLSEEVYSVLTTASSTNTIIDHFLEYYLADVQDNSEEASTELTLSALNSSGLYAASLPQAVGSFTPVDWNTVIVLSAPLRSKMSSESPCLPTEPFTGGSLPTGQERAAVAVAGAREGLMGPFASLGGRSAKR